MMAYKVRTHKAGDGEYTLEYGKGQKKLMRRLVKYGNAWRFVEAPKALLGKFPLLDNAKQAFETWAGQAYGGDPAETNPLIDSPVSDKGTILEAPAPSRHGPPPPMTGVRPGPPPPVRASAGVNLLGDTDFFGDYDTPDPLDPLNYEKIDGHTHVTEIGALRHVWNWVNNRYVMKGKIIEIPLCFESVRRRLARHEPNNLDYQLPTPITRGR